MIMSLYDIYIYIYIYVYIYIYILPSYNDTVLDFIGKQYDLSPVLAFHAITHVGQPDNASVTPIMLGCFPFPHVLHEVFLKIWQCTPYQFIILASIDSLSGSERQFRFNPQYSQRHFLSW